MYKQADLNAIKEVNNALNVIKFDKKTEDSAKYQLALEEINLNNSFTYGGYSNVFK